MKYPKLLAFNAASLLLLILILVSFSLSAIFVLIALAIMILNIWNIVKNQSHPQKRANAKYKGSKSQQSIEQFQKKVREAYEKSMVRQAEQYRVQDYYWSKNYMRQSDQIMELRKLPLAQQNKNSAIRREMKGQRDEGSSAKRVRAFFLSKKDETVITPQMKSKLKVIIEAHFNKPAFQNGKISGKIEEFQIMNCVKIINQFVNAKIELQMDEIIEDFDAVDRFLNKCFGASLTLQQPLSQNFITYAELLELAHIIEKKKAVPSKLKTSCSVLQVSQKLAEVRKNINRLPCFTLSSNVIKLALALKYLRKDFSEVNIIFADFVRDERPHEGQKHIIRLQDDDRFFYHKYPQVKTKQASIVLLLVLINIFQKYTKSGKHLIKQLGMQLGLKCY